MRPLFIFLIMSIYGCSSSIPVTQKLDMEKYYQRDMVVTVNGITEEGYLAVPFAAKYDFLVEAKGDLDVFIMSTCHKEEKKEKAWNVTTTIRSGLFGWGKKVIDQKNKVTFTYYPNKNLEDDGNCSMELRGIEKILGRNSWAFIDFESSIFKLHGTLQCNGRDFSINGVGVCQSRMGLKQALIFDEEVHPATNTCGFKGDATRYEVGLVRGPCLTMFIGKTSHNRMKVTTIGYEDILIRGE